MKNIVNIGRRLSHQRVADSCWGAMVGAALYAALAGFPDGWLMPMAATSGILVLAVTLAGYLRMRYIEKRTFDEFMAQVKAQERLFMREPPGDYTVWGDGESKRV